MESSDPCPLRYIWKGRTFCAAAIRERKYTTTEVIPSACQSCQARELLHRAACGHLAIGVEIDQYGGSHHVGVYHASCEKLIERVRRPDQCGQEACPHWVPMDGDKFENARAEAVERQRSDERSGVD